MQIIYNKLSLFLVMPSLFESISIPIYEAFSLGVPVCASNVCGIPEQVADAGLLFDPESVEDMKEMIKILLKDAELRERLIIAGKKRLRELDHKNFGRKILGLALKLAEREGLV